VSETWTSESGVTVTVTGESPGTSAQDDPSSYSAPEVLGAVPGQARPSAGCGCQCGSETGGGTGSGT
jgi:hypothetical protein